MTRTGRFFLSEVHVWLIIEVVIVCTPIQLCTNNRAQILLFYVLNSKKSNIKNTNHTQKFVHTI